MAENGPGPEDGEPRNLPAVPGAAEPEEMIFEGEIVDEQDPPPPSPAGVIRVVQAAAGHEHTRTAARHAAYIAIGAGVAFRRHWDARTTARYERGFRAAEASGDHEAMLKWEHQRAAFLKERHHRRMDWIKVPAEILLQVPKIALGLLIVLAALGILLAVGTRDPREIAAPVEVLAHVIRWAVLIIAVSWAPVLLAAPCVTVYVLWWLGRRHATTLPGWVATAADADMDVSIDETTLARALEALRIPQVRDYLRQGLPLQYITPCRQEGRGTHAVIRLPGGVTAERIARRRADFATSVYRLAKEVWLTTGSEAGILDAWIADKGALEDGAGPYPLLESGFADVFKGLPFGRTLRGDPVKIPAAGRNTICGGMPEQGKSSAARAVACGYALDVTAELRIYIPDVNFDFERLKPRCSRYVMGAEDEHVERILGDLEELKDEVQARGQLLIDYEVPEVTRELASAGVGLHPVLFLLEEAHVAIQHHKYGKSIGRLLCDNVKLCRKRGIHMMVSTQAPTKDSMPRDVTRNCANGIAFAVGDHVANDALLGQGAYRGGHRATDLIPGTDRGTALCKGFSGQRSEVVQVYFLDVADGSDQVTPIIARSLAEIARRGLALPGSGQGRRAIEARDLLDDLDEVLGGERVKLRDAVGLLRGLAPAWRPYQQLTAKQLGAELSGRGVRTVNSSGTPYLDPADLRRVIAERSTADLDEE